MNGLAKGGIIVLFIGNIINIIIALAVLYVGLIFKAFFGIDLKILVTFITASIIFSILIILFGILAIFKKSEAFKITCGVLALVSVVFVWISYFFPAVIAFVGGIITLCGKKVDKIDKID